MAAIFIDYPAVTGISHEMPQLVVSPFTSDFTSDFGPGTVSGWAPSPVQSGSSLRTDAYSGVARTAAVQLDTNPPVFSYGGVSVDIVSPSQTSAIVICDGQPVIGATRTSIAQYRSPIASDANLVSDANLPVYWAWVANTFIDVPSPMSWQTATRVDEVLPMAPASNIYRDSTPSIAWIGVFYGAQRLGAMYGSQSQIDNQQPSQWASTFQFPSPDVVISFGSLAYDDLVFPQLAAGSLAGPNQAPLVYAATALHDFYAPEMSGYTTAYDLYAPLVTGAVAQGVAISGDVVSPLSWNATFQTDRISPLSMLVGVANDMSAPYLAGFTSQIEWSVPLQWSIASLIDAAAPVSSSVSIVGDVVASVGIGTGLISDWPQPMGWLASVALEFIDLHVPILWYATVYPGYEEPVQLAGPTWFRRAHFKKTVAPSNTYVTWVDGHETRKVEY